MSDAVWSAQNTTSDAIEAALRGLLRERHAANSGLAPARVLNLIVVADRAWKGEIANRLARVGRYQASRTILCSVEEDRKRMDARAVMSYDETPGGTLNVAHEHVEIDIGPEHLPRLDAIVDPVLVSELTTMLWVPHGHQEAVSALLPMIDVILLDSDDEPEASAGLQRAAELQESVYVVDLAWLRTTPWRERLAATFDPPERRGALSDVRQLGIRHRQDSAASAALLAGWLASRLDWKTQKLAAQGGGELTSEAQHGQRRVEVVLAPYEQDAPGLAGVSVAWAEKCELSLDRARGGLCAHQRRPDGSELTWHVLGASRGEGGILGEGVRQALLRDATYPPALAAARTLCP